MWISDRIGGAFASGRIVQIDRLPVGQNVLEVEAINSRGAVGTDTVTVFIGDMLAAPGPTLSVAPQSIGWHIAGDDTAPQVRNLDVTNAGTRNLGFDGSFVLIGG